MDSDKQMQFKSVVYTIKLDKEQWIVEKKKEKFTDGEKKLDKSKFPKAGTDLDEVKDMTNKDYWGLTEENKWDNLKSLDDKKREESASNYFRGYWTGNEDKTNGKTADMWTSNWDNGCNDVFGSNAVKVKDALSQVKGKGVKWVIYPEINKPKGNG